MISGPDRALWQGRRVFLTGHTGFKGGWLALWLTHLGAQVRGYALDPVGEPNLFTAARVDAAVHDVRGDINDFDRLAESIAEFQPEVIFHLAAQPLVRASYADPLGTYRTNVMGTAHVLEAVRSVLSVRAVVCVTTDKCYENREWEWGYRESDPLGGYDPYSSSKASAELVAAAWRQSFFPVASFAEHRCGIATARAGNVLGGGDWATDRLLPDLLRGFASGVPVAIRHPGSIRPWQHVLEPLAGYLRLAERLVAGDAVAAAAWNFGPHDEDAWTVARIADHMTELWGKGAAWTPETDDRLHEAATLRLDTSRAQAHLGWRPRLRVGTALEWLVAWHHAHLAGQDMSAFTLAQIAAYEDLLRQP